MTKANPPCFTRVAGWASYWLSFTPHGTYELIKHEEAPPNHINPHFPRRAIAAKISRERALIVLHRAARLGHKLVVMKRLPGPPEENL